MAFNYSLLTSQHFPIDHWFHGINWSRAERMIYERERLLDLEAMISLARAKTILKRTRRYTAREYVRALHWGARHEDTARLYRAYGGRYDDYQRARLEATALFMLGCM